MKKIVFTGLIIFLVNISAFAQTDSDQSGSGLVHYQIGVDVMYLHGLDGGAPSSLVFSISNIRVGINGDLLLSFGTFEAGVELGINVGILQSSGLPVFDIPADILFHIDLMPDGSMGIDIIAGIWIKLIPADNDTNGIYLNGGARFDFYNFYLGCDFIYGITSIYSIALGFELGYKFTI